MQTNKPFEPIVIFRQSFCQWRKNAFAVIAIYSLTLFLTYALRFYSAISREFYICMGEWVASAFLTVMYAAVFFLNSFLTLIVIHYFLGDNKKRVTFDAAFHGARGTITLYFKSLLFYISIVFILAGFGLFFFAAGRTYFGPQSPAGVNIPVLLITSTITVILWIASVWYGFFFSLAPLISAFEGKGARVALGVSKSRIKNCPWRYLAVFLIFLSLYFFAGVIIYAVAAVFAGGKRVLGWIDPVMMALWTPLWLGIWVHSYQKLKAMKES